jgi:hypothetical protein
MKVKQGYFSRLVKQNLKEMAMDLPPDNEPHKDIQNKLAQGDTPIEKVPLPDTENPNQNFQELLASERYQQVVQKAQEYTGLQISMKGEQGIMPLSQLMMTAHNTIVATEQAHRQELEQLAIELVTKEMGIPEDSFMFDVKIVGLGEIDTDDINKEENQEEEEQQEMEIEENLMNTIANLDLEKAKRRMINAMIQGISKRGHFMYHYVAGRIAEITGSDDLINQYGILMSLNDTLYWQLSDDTMKMMMGSQSGTGGKESVDRNTEPPTIRARAANFPILVHEIIKGIVEIFAIQGQPEDGFEEVKASEDTFEKEVWDVRLGPAIWDRIRSQFPENILHEENLKELQNYLLVAIFKLPAREFLVLMKEVVSGSPQGKRLINDLMDGIQTAFQNQDYTMEVEDFQDDIKEISSTITDDELYKFLDSVGIQRPSTN